MLDYSLKNLHDVCSIPLATNHLGIDYKKMRELVINHFFSRVDVGGGGTQKIWVFNIWELVDQVTSNKIMSSKLDKKRLALFLNNYSTERVNQLETVNWRMPYAQSAVRLDGFEFVMTVPYASWYGFSIKTLYTIIHSFKSTINIGGTTHDLFIFSSKELVALYNARKINIERKYLDNAKMIARVNELCRRHA